MAAAGPETLSAVFSSGNGNLEAASASGSAGGAVKKPPSGAVTITVAAPSKPNSKTRLPVASRIQTLYAHVPADTIIQTSLTEMEKLVLLGSSSVGVGKHGQDACTIEDHVDEKQSEALQEYNEMIEKAKEAIAEKAQEKIQSNDTILIYGYSEIIKETLLCAIRNGKKFSLVIVESSSTGCGHNSTHLERRPISGDRRMTQNGQEIHALHMLEQLGPELKTGLLSVTHTHLNGLSFIIRRVTKLLLSAYALLTNGGILGRIGTAQVALMAHKKNIPVVVCCETFKFCDKSPSDSFFQNERGQLNATKNGQVVGIVDDRASIGPSTPHTQSPTLVDHGTSTTSISENAYLKTPVLKYDITPSQLVTAVITEVDIFPATSIPLLVRVQENRNKNRSTIRTRNDGQEKLFQSPGT